MGHRKKEWNLEDIKSHANKYGYKVLSNIYVDNKTKISFECECGNLFDISWNSFYNGNRCLNCSSKKQKSKTSKTNEVFVKELQEKTNGEYMCYEPYLKAKHPLLIEHIVCGYKWKCNPDNLLNGKKQCPKCQGQILNKTTEYFKSEVFDLVKNKYSVVGEYIGANTHIKIKHNTCGEEYSVTPHNFLFNRRCPLCNDSKGETKIRTILNENNIFYEKEYDKLKIIGLGGGLLRFDFAIFNDNKTLKCLIEYDGEFHYKPIMGDESLKYQETHDEIKNQYCKNNDINLIRIPYWEFDNVEDILLKNNII